MYPLILHKSLSIERWAQFGAEKEIIMIANELKRLQYGLEMDLDEDTLKECIERAIELLDLTIECQKGSLRKELLRFRAAFVGLYLLNKESLKKKPDAISQLYKILLLLRPYTATLILNA